jgi:hypothetical protein
MVNSLSARRGAVDLDQIGGAFDCVRLSPKAK